MRTDLEWVIERANCCPFAVFRKLQIETEKDVDLRNGLTPLPLVGQFKLEPDTGEAFSVSKANQHGTRVESVQFRCDKSGISVRRDNKTFLEATLTLNDDGECRLRVKDKETDLALTTWQFRKRALENLFFGA